MATAVVTGAASGIGKSLARRLAADGYQVHLVDLAATEDFARSIHGVPHRLDVSQPDAMEHLAAKASGAAIVCLNAGITGTELGAPWEVGPDEWRRVLDVNFLGVVNGLRAFVPKLVASEDPAAC